MIRPRFVPAAALALAVAACLPASIRPSPTPSAAPTPLPTLPPAPTPSATPPRPTPTPGPSFTLYTVKGGDTLTSIAHRFETSARSIAYWNRDQYPSLDPESADYRPNRIERGWVLRLLPGQEYVPPPDDGETGESPTPSPPDDEYESLPPGSPTLAP
jgi:nucleoid-associated protein YgaU